MALLWPRPSYQNQFAKDTKLSFGPVTPLSGSMSHFRSPIPDLSQQAKIPAKRIFPYLLGIQSAGICKEYEVMLNLLT